MARSYDPGGGVRIRPITDICLPAARGRLYDEPMLLGRAPECEAIDALLEAARGGKSGALVLRGEPGIGKSTLLAYARDRADGMLAMAASGVESEAELPF